MIVIYDLEYTAWPLSQAHQWSDEGEHREVVQIGAVMISLPSLEEINTLSIFVKPKINPQLSGFFIELTGITQEVVDREGLPFKIALEEFREWVGDLPMYSWGRSDDAVLRENCSLESLSFPFTEQQFFNMRNVFNNGGIDASKYNSNNILQAFNKELPYRAHNALDDAKTILLALRELPDAANFLLGVQDTLKS